jgi:hypothetical protein
MKAATAQQPPETAPSKPDRWLPFLIVTVLLNLANIVLVPAFLTDALTPVLAVLLGGPSLWGFYSFLAFRTKRERIVGYVAILPAVLWSFLALSLLWEYGWTR